MVPAVKEKAIRSVWSASRPLIEQEQAKEPQLISRTFDCYDHKQRDNLEGLISIIGGKLTTYRPMGRRLVDNALGDAGSGDALLAPSQTGAIPLTKRIDDRWKPPAEAVAGPQGNYLAWAYGADAEAIERGAMDVEDGAKLLAVLAHGFV